MASTTTHDYGVPTADSPFATAHQVLPPVAPPPAPPLPCLREITSGRHPGESPGYEQLSFAFSGALPGYDIRYVPSLLALGTGAVVPVPGAGAVLQVEFRNAQVHDESGGSCLLSSPKNPLGGAVIVSVVPAGDFEGSVLFGVGVASDPGAANGPGRVRVVELERVDDGDHVFVVAVQVATE